MESNSEYKSILFEGDFLEKYLQLVGMTSLK